MISVFEASVRWAQKRALSFEAYETLESTNLLAQKNSSHDPNFKLYLAGSQTKGRGRGSNVWVSPKTHSSLLCSFSFRISSSPPPFLSLILGLHLFECVNKFFETPGLSLKPPNDLYLGDKKIAGILVQVLQERLIVGLGLNVLQNPDSLRQSGRLLQSEKIWSEKNWASFLDELYKWPVEAKHLTSSIKTDLVESINPFFDNKLLSIQDDGSILFSNGETKAWHEL